MHHGGQVFLVKADYLIDVVVISGVLLRCNARALHQAYIFRHLNERLRTMQSIKREIPDFDDLEELVAESTRTVTASTVEDLDDLDTLLEESTALASAKRAQKQGRKLTAEQNELLAANHIAEQMQVWEPVKAVAHFIHTTCSCGHESKRFSSWYKLLEHRKQASSRLVRCDDHEGLPSSQYVTTEKVGYCNECLGAVGLPFTDAADLPMLTSLGEVYEQATEEVENEAL